MIVPTYGRPLQLVDCLQALARLDFPRESFEVIVVDDGSPSPVAADIEHFDQLLNLVLVWQANAGAGSARNAGADRARGRFLAFTDDDCVPEPGWLRALSVPLSQSSGRVAVGGRTVNGLPHRLLSCASHMLSDYPYEQYPAEPQTVRFFTSNNLAMAAVDFRELGGFSARFRTYEDRELCDRCLRSGFHMAFATDAVVRHNRAMTLRSFCRQHFNYGRGAYQFYQGDRGRPADRVRGVVLGMLRHLVREAFRTTRGAEPYALTGLLLLSQAVSSAGFTWERMRRRGDAPRVSRRPQRSLE